MEKNIRKDNIIKRWYKLTQPHKGYLLGQVFFFSVHTIFYAIITIFAARTINCMYSQNWNGAFFNLAMELMTIIVRNIGMHLEYVFYNKQIRHVRMVVADKIYNKILTCKNSEFKAMTKEKVVNIALNNMSNLSEFPDSIASFIAHSFQVIFTLVAVFVSNIWAGLIVSVLGVVNFFVYYKFNKKLGFHMLERHEKMDEMYKSYSKVIEGKSVINELHGKQKYKKELVKDVEEYANAHARYYETYSWKNNIYWATWQIVIYMITALLMFFVSKGSLDIAVYLIIVPYLSTCTDKLCSLFDKTGNLENMRVDVDRVNLILELNDKEMIDYGKINTECAGYNLGFIDVSWEKKDKDDCNLNNADISFKMQSINVIKGESGSGKRIVFDLLRRYKKPDNGVVLLDNLNLYDYNEKTFKNHIDYCASHPEFILGTIKENLMLVCKKMRKIEEVCDKVGILSSINKLPKGFNTNISEIKESGLLFLIGLVRAVLSECKILMVYELPQDTDEKFRKNVVRLLKKYDIDKTIILFTHSNDYDEIGDLVYEIKKGNVKLIKAK